ncbi:uncharacterized protein N7498_007390 [Penicillium cinerascens]|uniref:Uncharacterized protein n=1 Tax=Penicillium cinerascens TaxID=70096 RepID=A0A9W9JJZ6_9EURO|nr:uncharacterized protein N7498_007390 [Penicillium cinerascens]KAJ5198273.1 hypothetical protein N7498_007390 [Penicillium cinerascens]
MGNQQEKNQDMGLCLFDRFSFFSSKIQKATTSSSWDALFPDGDLSNVFLEKHKGRSEPNQPTWWIDIRDATEEDVHTVSQALSIHPLTAEDIAIREPREKVDVFKNYYLISFQTLVSHFPGQEERQSIPASAVLYILVFQYGVVTFSPSESRHMNRVRDRIQRMHDPSILTSDWVCYAMIDDIIDSFEPFARAAERESEAIEDQVFTIRIDDAKTLIPQVDVLRKRIAHITRCLNGNNDVLSGYVKRCQAPDKYPVFPDGELLLYLGDVQDHIITNLSTLGHIDEIIGRSQANYLAQISATNIRFSLTISSGLSKITLLATVFVPCHLVTGLFGMNVSVPGEAVPGEAVPGEHYRDLSWFLGIVGCFAAFIVVSISMAVKYRLL